MCLLRSQSKSNVQNNKKVAWECCLHKHHQEPERGRFTAVSQPRESSLRVSVFKESQSLPGGNANDHSSNYLFFMDSVQELFEVFSGIKMSLPT